MFLLDCAARRLTDSTLQFCRPKLSVFCQWCHERKIRALDDITAHDIRRFPVDIHRRGLSSRYQYNLARAVRAFLNYCVRDELLDVSPFGKVQMPKLEKKILAALSPADIKSVLHSCDGERDRAPCLFLLDSGARQRVGRALSPSPACITA